MDSKSPQNQNNKYTKPRKETDYDDPNHPLNDPNVTNWTDAQMKEFQDSFADGHVILPGFTAERQQQFVKDLKEAKITEEELREKYKEFDILAKEAEKARIVPNRTTEYYPGYVRVPNLTGMTKPTGVPIVPNPCKQYYRVDEIPSHGHYNMDPDDYHMRENRGILMRIGNKFKPGPLKTIVGVSIVTGMSLGTYSLIKPKDRRVHPTQTPEWREAQRAIDAKSKLAEFGALVELQRAIDSKKKLEH